MSVTGLAVFDATVHTTNAWLKRLMQIEGWQDRREAYRALRATLHALRDRLTVEEAAELSAQLPMLVRGFYFEGWDPTGKPLKVRDRKEFLGMIADDFVRARESVHPEPVARAVFTLLAMRVSDGEIEDVIHLLPADLRELWPHIDRIDKTGEAK